MFELWADKEKPEVRLVVRRGSGLPADLGPRDWLLLGPTEPSPDIARQVEVAGYAFVHSNEPPPAPGRLKDSSAAGA